jgi:hypothetical protein
MQKHIFPLKNNKITMDLRMSSTSLHHLIIKMEIEFFTYFYSKKYKIKLGRGKKFYLSRVLYIGSNKMLNDYYAFRV